MTVIDNEDDREPTEPSPMEPESPEAKAATPTDPIEAADEPTEAPESGEPADAAEVVAKPSETTEEEEESAQKDEKGESSPAKPRVSRAHQMRLASMYRAYRAGRPIEGTIEAVIKGGYEVKLGKLRGFCPHSQIQLHRVEDPEALVGKKSAFKITQLRRGGEDIVVSRRALLEAEQKEEAKAVRATLIEGAIMQGRIAGIADFGAFVDLGAGVMGLVHVSELSHTRVTRVGDAVKVGDAVSVKILKLNEESRRISLSIRQATADPWSDLAEKFRPGQVYTGAVKRLTDFGAFVELAPGIEALAPASEFPPSREGWREGLAAGQTKDWLVLSVDPAQHRISVTPPVEGTNLDDLPPLEAGAMLSGRVQRVEKFGVFIWLGPGRVGLMPNIWTGTPRGEDMARRYPIGDAVEVQVVEVTEGGRRIRLAKKGVDTEAKAAQSRGRPPREPRREGRRQPKDGSLQDAANGAFGSLLADRLRAALGKPDDET